MENCKKRCNQIAQAIFDRFIQDLIINNRVIRDSEINTRELKKLAREVECEFHELYFSIYASCARIGGQSIQKIMPTVDEKKIIMLVIKYKLKKIADKPLKNYLREVCRVTIELNQLKPALNLKAKELFQFVLPLYQEAYEEVYN